MAEEYTPGYIIGQCKRKWRDSHKITTYNDELTRDEGAIFKDDETLVRLFLEVKKKEQEIIDHIDRKVREYRKAMATEVKEA